MNTVIIKNSRHSLMLQNISHFDERTFTEFNQVYYNFIEFQTDCTSKSKYHLELYLFIFLCMILWKVYDLCQQTIMSNIPKIYLCKFSITFKPSNPTATIRHLN